MYSMKQFLALFMCLPLLASTLSYRGTAQVGAVADELIGIVSEVPLAEFPDDPIPADGSTNDEGLPPAGGNSGVIDDGSTDGTTTVDGSTDDSNTADDSNDDGSIDGSTGDSNTANGSTDDGSTSDSNTAGGSTDDGSTSDSNTADGSTDDGSTDDGSTDDGSTDDSNTADDSASDDPAADSEPGTEEDEDPDSSKPTPTANPSEDDKPVVVAATSMTVTVQDEIAENGRLVAEVTGGPIDATDITYQWYKNDTPITGATGKVLNVFDDAHNAVVVAPYKYTVNVKVGDSSPVQSDPYQAIYYAELHNGSFEDVKLPVDKANAILHSDDGVYAWYTSKEAGGQRIGDDTYTIQDYGWQSTTNTYELFNATSTGKNWGGWHMVTNPSIPMGSQAAEIDADDCGTLYQAILTYPGDTIKWGLAHRGRAGEDEAAIYFSDVEPTGINIAANYEKHFRTNNDGWRFYSGEYPVPEGRYITYVCLQSVDSAATLFGNRKSTGNLVDYVQASTREPEYPQMSIPANFWVGKIVKGGIGGTFRFKCELEGNANAVFVDGKSWETATTSISHTNTDGKTKAHSSFWNSNDKSIMTFTEAGTYVFKISEFDIPEGYVCDNEYRVVVKVGDNAGGHDGYGVGVTYYRNDKEITKNNLHNGNCFEFTNEYTGYTLEKSADKESVQVGEEVNYTVTIRNLTASQQTVNFSDDLAGGSLTLNGTVSVTIGEAEPEEYDSLDFELTLEAGQTATITYTATVNEGVDANTELKNTATTVMNGKTLTDDAIVTVENTPKLISIVKERVSELPKTVKADDEIEVTYKITVTGTPGASYIVSDEGVDLVEEEDNSYTGVLGESGKVEIYVTKTVTVTEADEAAGKVTILNQAYVKPNDENTKPIEPQDPENDPTDPDKGYPSNEVEDEIPFVPTPDELKLTSIRKELVTAPSDIPASVKVGDVVTLTYKITVTGDEGASYVVSDADVELAEGSSWEGTLDETGVAEILVTKTVTVTEADEAAGKIVVANQAYVKPNDDDTKPIEPQDPENDPTDPDKGYPSNEVETEIPFDPETPPEDPETPPENPETPPENPVTPPDTFEPETPTTPEPPATPETPNTPAETVEVPNGDVPLADLTPEDLLDIFSEVPLVETVVDDLMDIFTETPLADLTVDDLMDILVDVPLADLTPEELLDIFDNVPLSNVPKTGDNSQVWGIFAMASGLGLVWLSLENKKREKTDE